MVAQMASLETDKWQTITVRLFRRKTKLPKRKTALPGHGSMSADHSVRHTHIYHHHLLSHFPRDLHYCPLLFFHWVLGPFIRNHFFSFVFPMLRFCSVRQCVFVCLSSLPLTLALLLHMMIIHIITSTAFSQQHRTDLHGWTGEEVTAQHFLYVSIYCRSEHTHTQCPRLLPVPPLLLPLPLPLLHFPAY